MSDQRSTSSPSTAGPPVAARAPEDEPWRALPSSLADLIEPELGAVTEEILAAIARQVPEYARPLEGSFGRGVERGVEAALGQFTALIRDPATPSEAADRVYIELGRGEFRQGRTLDSLQAAYRVGARTAWRRLAAAAGRGGVASEDLALLAEAIFAYIDRISARSVAGYADARSEDAGERRRARRRLLARLLDPEPPARGELEELERAARWAEPRTLAALCCEPDELATIERGLGEGILAAEREGFGCVAFPDPAGPGRGALLRRACAGTTATIGPVGPPGELASSWRLALEARALDPQVDSEAPLAAEEHLLELALARSEPITRLIAERRLAPLSGLTPRSRAGLEQTALAYLSERGNAAAAARRLGVHPQTVRYRLARLAELLGDALDDPATRFELELALRAREGRGITEPPRAPRFTLP